MRQPLALYSGDRETPRTAPSVPQPPDADPAFRIGRVQPEPNLLLEYLHTLARWWRVILGCGLAGGLISLALTLPVLPVYRARTSLDIQSINSDFLNMRNVAPTGDSGASTGDSYVQTQIKLLQSSTVLERTMAKLKAEPPANAIDRDDLVSRFKRSLRLSRGGDLGYHDMVDDAARRVKVKPLGITRLVEITCDSWDAKFSARFCNTLTEEFKAIDLETRAAEAGKTSEFLTRQVVDVRQKAEESQRRLEAATGGDGLALSQESNAIGEDRLRQLQSELVRAQGERMEKESELRTALTSSPDSIAAAQDSPVYRGYQQKLAELNAMVAELVPPLTEQNPKVIHLRAEIRQVQDGMQQSRKDIVERLRNDFDSARHHEDLLNASYAAMQAGVSSEMSKTERVNLLRREVDSEQQLYQTLLQHAREAGFASAMQTTTIRVVDAATPVKVSISPRRGVAAIAGLLLGSLCGLAFAFFRERTANVFRMPGEAERHLQVRELGVIPSNALGKRRLAVSARPADFGSLTTAAESQLPALGCWAEKFSVVAEAYRNTTHSLLLAANDRRRCRIYVVTSPNPGEGKTTITTNLGIALSKAKLRVLIVDGDLRKPGLHKNLMAENTFGLRNILREEIDVATAPREKFCKPTLVANLWMICAGGGREEVVELLHSGAAARLLDRVAREFDVVLIDTPPMLHMADARILASRADGVLLVFRAGLTERDQAAYACDLFENDRVPVVGAILNDFNPAREGKKSYYSSYYKYSEQVEEVDEAAFPR